MVRSLDPFMRGELVRARRKFFLNSIEYNEKIGKHSKWFAVAPGAGGEENKPHTIEGLAAVIG